MINVDKILTTTIMNSLEKVQVVIIIFSGEQIFLKPLFHQAREFCPRLCSASVLLFIKTVFAANKARKNNICLPARLD